MYGLSAESEQGERRQSQGCLPKSIRQTLTGIPQHKTVYATMQPVPAPPSPSASTGVEGMGSESDVMVKRVEK